MRKNLLALSIATMIGGLGFAGGAAAGVIATDATATVLEVNPGGLGHKLVVPYYNAQSTNATMLNLVNTDTTNGKAVKVRFRGASNSDDVFDFTLLMSPGDAWSAMVAQNADGIATLTTNDTTCTLPAMVGRSDATRTFVLDRLPTYGDAASRAAQTREGYVEILNMADIAPAIGAVTPATNSALYTAVKHVSGTAPCTAASLDFLKNDITDMAVARTRGLTNPTTGLTANWTIINVNDATSWAGTATAIEARVAAGGAPGLAAYVLFPQAGGNANVVASADPLFIGGVNGSTGTTIQPQWFDLPDLSTPYLNTAVATPAQASLQAAALSNSLAVTSISNDYITADALQASTDWVYSMPTRRYAVAMAYGATAATNTIVKNAANAGHFNGNVGFSTDKTQICVNTGTLTAFDQEESFRSSGFVISPGTAVTPKFCGEVSVMSFNAGGVAAVSSLAAAVARTDVDVTYADGWAKITTPGALGAGMPIVGSSFIRAVNGNVGAGMAGTYGAAYAHRYTVAP